MLAKLTAFNHRLMPGRSLDEQMDNAFILAQQLVSMRWCMTTRRCPSTSTAR